MPRLIDADAIPWCSYDLDNYRWFEGVDKEVVDEMPTIDPESLRPHGRWVDNHCTNCGMTPLGEELWGHLDVEPPRFELCFPICPCCGAKMDGDLDG